MDTNTIGKVWTRFHAWINGAPNEYLTLALILTGIALILIGLHAPAEFKALTLAWVWLP